MRKGSALFAVLTMLLVAGPMAGAANDPVRLSFEKCPSAEGVWTGTVDGDVTGGLTTMLRSARQTGNILHVNFDWVISAGTQSFTANLDGTLSLRTGRVVMNGTVVDGRLEGAQVHEQGQLAPDLGVFCFRGSIRVMPGSAG
jgi:hypothetical protein